jgi:hypothetical protein
VTRSCISTSSDPLGIAATSVSHAAVIVGIVPLLVALIGRGHGGPQVGRRSWAGYGLAVGGFALVAGSAGGGATTTGDLLVLGSAALSGVFILGTLGTLLPFWLFAWGQARVSARLAGTFVNREPVVGTALGWLIFANPAGVEQIAGAVGVLTGIAMSVLLGPVTPIGTRRVSRQDRLSRVRRSDVACLRDQQIMASDLDRRRGPAGGKHPDHAARDAHSQAVAGAQKVQLAANRASRRIAPGHPREMEARDQNCLPTIRDNVAFAPDSTRP